MKKLKRVGKTDAPRKNEKLRYVQKCVFFDKEKQKK